MWEKGNLMTVWKKKKPLRYAASKSMSKFKICIFLIDILFLEIHLEEIIQQAHGNIYNKMFQDKLKEFKKEIKLEYTIKLHTYIGLPYIP